MKKAILGVFIIASLIGCNSKKSKKESSGTEVKITSGIVALNITTNQYNCVTLERTIKDTIKMVVTDSTSGKMVTEKQMVRDTTYKALWPLAVPDSTGKTAIKTKDGKDSTVWRFVPVDKQFVLMDLNKDWK